jgi:hypothetical protein
MIFAISAAPAAIPVNPKTAAITAMTRNVSVQRNITFIVFLYNNQSHATTALNILLATMCEVSAGIIVQVCGKTCAMFVVNLPFISGTSFS